MFGLNAAYPFLNNFNTQPNQKRKEKKGKKRKEKADETGGGAGLSRFLRKKYYRFYQ